MFGRRTIFFLEVACFLSGREAALNPHEVHALIVSPEDGAIIQPGTHVPISYKVSTWVENQPMKGACLEASLVEDNETQPARTCVEGIDQFAMTPHLEGVYDLTVTVWASDGTEAVDFKTEPRRVIISNEATLDGAAYGRKEGFRMVYEFGHWGEHGRRSGHGSSKAGAASDMTFLLDFFQRHHITSIFDAGCGAMEWQPALLSSFMEKSGWRLRYHGADIVQDVIASNRARFAEDVFLSFSVTDLVTDDIPRGFDAVLCRHALFHNTIDSVRDILETVQRSGAKYFLATTLRPLDDSIPSPDSEIVNADMAIGTDGRKLSLGGYRPIELEAPPFSLPPPLLFEPEIGPDGLLVRVEGRQQGIGVWPLPFLQLL